MSSRPKKDLVEFVSEETLVNFQQVLMVAVIKIGQSYLGGGNRQDQIGKKIGGVRVFPNCCHGNISNANLSLATDVTCTW